MRLKKTVFFYLIMLPISLPALAHEYWLEPDKFNIISAQTINVHIKVGQQFKGDNFAYLPAQVKSINLYSDNKEQAIKPRLGDYPAISFKPQSEGVYVLAVATNHFDTSYDSFDDFARFLKKEDLEWVLVEHQKRGLVTQNFTEAYRRFAKSIIQVGHHKGSDKQLSLEFEWVLKSDLDDMSENSVQAELWWRGKKLANYQATLFVSQNGKVSTKILKTDHQGVLTFKKIPEAKYLISAVQMIVPDKQIVNKLNAIWESVWTSLTFSTR